MSLPHQTFEEWCRINNPLLLYQWNTTKNGRELPPDLRFKSNIQVWWICEKGHEWKATPADCVAGRGCPYCSHHRVIPGETDLGTMNPGLATEWHPDKNENLEPSDVTAKSEKMV